MWSRAGAGSVPSSPHLFTSCSRAGGASKEEAEAWGAITAASSR